jgi:hypothetical protein
VRRVDYSRLRALPTKFLRLKIVINSRGFEINKSATRDYNGNASFGHFIYIRAWFEEAQYDSTPNAAQ